MMNSLVGTKFRLISGYTDNDLDLALERGEVESRCGLGWASLKATKPDWIRDKKIKFLVQMALDPPPELKDVPFALAMIKKPDDRLLMELASAQLAIGRPMVAPPEVAPVRVAALRKSLDDTYRDPAFLAECDKLRLECDSPMSGQQMQDILRRVFDSPASVVARLRDIYEAKEGAN